MIEIEQQAIDLFGVELDTAAETVLARFAAHVEQHGTADAAEFGGPGSGYHGHEGRPGVVGGSKPDAGGVPAPVRLTQHAFQRMRERNKYGGVRATLKQLEGRPTPSGAWYCAMQRGDRLDGWLVGEDGVVKTVLGAWYAKDKLTGDEIMLAENAAESKLSIQRSIAWQLDNLTLEIAATFCEIAGLDAMTPAQLVARWEDWSIGGLETLLIARSEVEDGAPDA